MIMIIKHKKMECIYKKHKSLKNSSVNLGEYFKAGLTKKYKPKV